MGFMRWFGHRKPEEAQPVPKPISHKWSEEEDSVSRKPWSQRPCPWNQSGNTPAWSPPANESPTAKAPSHVRWQDARRKHGYLSPFLGKVFLSRCESL